MNGKALASVGSHYEDGVTALHQAGYTVSVICPKGEGYDKTYEQMDGVHIYRHPRGVEGSGAVTYLLEYAVAFFWEFVLSLKVAFRHGFNILHACNPPDLIFLIAIFYKFFFGKKFLFDQHDPAPELYAVKFGRQDFFYRLLLLFERWTFRSADGSLATNPTLKQQAVERGGMAPDRVWIVRSVPDLGRFSRCGRDSREAGHGCAVSLDVDAAVNRFDAGDRDRDLCLDPSMPCVEKHVHHAVVSRIQARSGALPPAICVVSVVV